MVAATSARPSEPLVQFSRKRLSPGTALLAVVALHARNELQEVDQAQLPVEPPRWQRAPSGVAPALVLVAPDAQHDPAVEAIEQPAHVRAPVVVAPAADDRVELVQNALEVLGVAPVGGRAHLVLEALDRAVGGDGVQARTSGLVAQPPPAPDPVAQELKAPADVD